MIRNFYEAKKNAILNQRQERMQELAEEEEKARKEEEDQKRRLQSFSKGY